MRVLLLGARAPDTCALGGVEIHVADLASHFDDRIEPLAAHLRADSVVIEAFRPVRRELALLPARDLAGALTTALVGCDVSILHIHSPQMGPDALADAAIASGVRVVLTLHDVGLVKFDARRLIQATDVVVAPTRFVRDCIAKMHPAIADRTRLIAWGVPPQERASRRRGGKLRVAFVGVLAEDKGAARLPALIAACAHLPIEWHLFGATEGRSLRAIRRVVPNVRAHGAYRRTELGRLLADAGIDVVMLPSIVPESFSMTLSECISAGVPVVASDVGAFAERVRDEGCGWLFDPWQPESLGAALASLIDADGSAAVARLDPRWLPTPAGMALEHERLYLELGREERRARTSDASSVERRLLNGRAVRGGAVRYAWRALRRTHFYRELALRRLLPEKLRSDVELFASTLLDRLNR
jgi:glycosyltransferase involved in cell wall biosynthesis